MPIDEELRARIKRRAQELFASYGKLSAYLSELGLAAPAVVPVDTISVTTDYFSIAPALPAELSVTHAVPAVQLALDATAGVYRAYGEALQAMNIAQRHIRFYREEIDALPGWIAEAQQQLTDLQAEPCAPVDASAFELRRVRARGAARCPPSGTGRRNCSTWAWARRYDPLRKRNGGKS